MCRQAFPRSCNDSQSVDEDMVMVISSFNHLQLWNSLRRTQAMASAQRLLPVLGSGPGIGSATAKAFAPEQSSSKISLSRDASGLKSGAAAIKEACQGWPKSCPVLRKHCTCS